MIYRANTPVVPTGGNSYENRNKFDELSFLIFNFVVTNPSTGAVIGRVPDMDAKDTERAVQAAYQAFQTFKKTTAKVSCFFCHHV